MLHFQVDWFEVIGWANNLSANHYDYFTKSPTTWLVMKKIPRPIKCPLESNCPELLFARSLFLIVCWTFPRSQRTWLSGYTLDRYNGRCTPNYDEPNGIQQPLACKIMAAFLCRRVSFPFVFAIHVFSWRVLHDGLVSVECVVQSLRVHLMLSRRGYSPVFSGKNTLQSGL